MTGSLTIRLSAAQRKALRARAAAAGKTESEIVRDAVDRELRAKRPLGERIGKYLGCLDVDPGAAGGDAWRDHIRRMNWRE